MNEIYTLEIPAWLLKTINDALVNMPYHIAAPAINEINKQLKKKEEKSE